MTIGVTIGQESMPFINNGEYDRIDWFERWTYGAAEKAKSECKAIYSTRVFRNRETTLIWFSYRWLDASNKFF